MIANFKCLGTLLIASVYSLLSFDVCQCKPTFDLDGILTSDKEQLTVDPKEQSAEDSFNSKRDWSSGFTSWGKRPWDKHFSVWGKRGRDQIAPSDRRSEDTDAYSPIAVAQTIPHKRKWSGFTSWGKRGDDNMEANELHAATDKRKWKSFNSWGKRNNEDVQDALNANKGWSDEDKMNADKKWSSFASWGKRNDDLVGDAEQKRKWSRFASWGKRNSFENLDEGLETSPEKRKWSKGFVSWGKRDNGQFVPALEKRKWSNWAALSTWGKRRWTGLPTWGKRSAVAYGANNSYKTDAIARQLLKVFDINGDEALNESELRTYINALVSPSIREAEEEKVEVE